MKYQDQEIVTKLTDKQDHIIDLYSIWEKDTTQPPPINKTPVIVASDKVLTVGDSFDPLKDVTANDPEDGPIVIKSEHVIKNEVNMDKPGIYQVTYRVADKEGLATEKTITVIVNPKTTDMGIINHVPIISATDKVLNVGDTFNPLDGVTAHDKEDGDITLTEANIIANNVNMNQAGTYTITYKVTDSKGASTVKTITVLVNPKMEELNHVPTINAIDKVLNVGDAFNPLDGVTAHDKEDGDITLTEANIIANNVNMNQAGTYTITYKVTDSKGASTVKTITVLVNPKMEELNHVPTINATDKVLTVGDAFNPLDGVTAHDKEDGDITLTEANIIANNVNMNQAGTYTITYKVTDSKGASTVKTITVTVNAKATTSVSKPDSKPTEKPSQDVNSNVTTSKPNKLPQTGDASNLGLLGLMFVGSGGMLLGLNRKKK